MKKIIVVLLFATFAVSCSNETKTVTDVVSGPIVEFKLTGKIFYEDESDFGPYLNYDEFSVEDLDEVYIYFTEKIASGKENKRYSFAFVDDEPVISAVEGVSEAVTFADYLKEKDGVIRFEIPAGTYSYIGFVIEDYSYNFCTDYENNEITLENGEKYTFSIDGLLCEYDD